jgi:dipeptidyl aminopeptidase/acylaminoacyl peptidase
VWLRSRKKIDAGRVGIVGVSLGSFVAQLAAGADGGFDRCAFLLGGGSFWSALYSGSKDTRRLQRIVEERGWSKGRMRELLRPIEPVSHIQGIREDGVLMINCLSDEVVPPATTRIYWEAVGRPVIFWYPGGHYALKDHVVEV